MYESECDDDDVKPVKRSASIKKSTYIDDSDESVQSIHSDEDDNDDKKNKSAKKKKVATPKNDKTKPSKSPNATTTSSSSSSSSITTTTTKVPASAPMKIEEKEDNENDENENENKQNISTTKSTTSTTAKVKSIDELTKGGLLSTEQAVKKVLLPYLKRENRPFNVNQLHENFNKRMPKGVLEKALTTLSEGNGVRCKEYGKSKIYFADQSTIACGNEKEIKELNVDIDKLKRQYYTVSQELAELKGEFIRIESEPTDSSLIQSLLTLENTVIEKRSRVSKITASKLEPFALTNAIKEHNYYRQMWNDRKRKCMDVVDMYLEESNKKKAVFLADVGIDTDEEARVTIPLKLNEKT